MHLLQLSNQHSVIFWHHHIVYIYRQWRGAYTYSPRCTSPWPACWNPHTRYVHIEAPHEGIINYNFVLLMYLPTFQEWTALVFTWARFLVSSLQQSLGTRLSLHMIYITVHNCTHIVITILFFTAVTLQPQSSPSSHTPSTATSAGKKTGT